MPNRTEEAQIRAVLEDWIDALRSKDAARVKSHGAADMVHYSMAPPLVADGTGLNALEQWFDTWQGPIGYELRDLAITAGDDIAFCTLPQPHDRHAAERQDGRLVPAHLGSSQDRRTLEDRARARVRCRSTWTAATRPPSTSSRSRQSRGSAAALSASAPASDRDSRRSRAASCGRASRPRRISPAADTDGISSPRGRRAAPASPRGRCRGR